MKAQPGTEKLSLEHKIYLTPNLEAPLVYLVHGRAGNFDVMWTFGRIIGEHCNLIAPQAPHAETVAESNAQGFSWWLLREVGNRLDQVQASADSLSNFILEAEDAYNLNPSKRIGFGFSQGAALLSLLIQEKPELFNSVALLAGFVVQSTPLESARKAEVFMAHGTKDAIVDIKLSQKGVDFLQQSGFNVEYHTEEIGHKIGAKSMRELSTWFPGQV